MNLERAGKLRAAESQFREQRARVPFKWQDGRASHFHWWAVVTLALALMLATCGMQAVAYSATAAGQALLWLGHTIGGAK